MKQHIHTLLLSLVLTLVTGYKGVHGNWNAKLDGRYQLMISEANNYFDTGRLDEALTIYKKAIKHNKHAPDAYMQIGHIHLQKDLTEIALDYFRKAEETVDHFIYPESRIELYMRMVVTFNRLNHSQDEKKRLYKILEIATNSNNKYYLDKAGWANFALALIKYKQKNYVESRFHFIASAKYNYRRRSSYLYICHYYCVRSQDQIDIDNKKYFKDKKHTENKRVFFNYYYAKFKESAVTDDEKLFLGKQQSKIKEIRNYKRVLESKKASRENKIIKESANETK